MLPTPAAEVLLAYVPPRTRIVLAALLRLPFAHVAASLRARHRYELDHASRLGDAGLLARLDGYCAARGEDSAARRTAAAVDAASARGQIAVLDWWRAWARRPSGSAAGTRRRLLYSARAVDRASANGHVEVLEWWLAASVARRGGADDDEGDGDRLEIKYTRRGFDDACVGGRVRVLEWWRRSGLRVVCSEMLLDKLSVAGGLEVMGWLRENGVGAKVAQSVWREQEHEIRWGDDGGSDALSVTMSAIATVTKNGYLSVLLWWEGVLGPAFSADSYWGCMEDATASGNVAVLEFWKDKVPRGRTHVGAALDGASARGDVAVLEWWRRSGFTLIYSAAAINNASCFGKVDSLQWWKESGQKLQYTHKAIDTASGNGHTAVLQWWKESGLELKYTEKAIYYACQNDRIQSLQWWVDSGLDIKLDNVLDQEAMESWSPAMVEWWAANEHARKGMQRIQRDEYTAGGSSSSFRTVKKRGSLLGSILQLSRKR
ncbi:hypothetical protein DFJ73DRAFT_875926 [Zopfochytrium polystomum]|nr:hypothetical protein DFJ73DRAFT_875926 [Zopfochytrium polystomum]